MAFLVLVVDTTDSIGDLNSKIQNSTNPHEALNNVAEYFNAINGGAKDASVQVTVRSTDPSVSTAGSGSTQVSYNLK